MLSSRNLLKPATGDPVVSPSQDVILGSYYMTRFKPYDDEKTLKVYSSSEEVTLAYGNEFINIQQPVRLMMKGKLVVVSAGRVLFNEILPKEIGFVNEEMNKKRLKNLV